MMLATSKREIARDASRCLRKHQAFALPPVREEGMGREMDVVDDLASIGTLCGG
jgi:hypothetical protein